ncbi:hypothetical protein BGZ76_001622 [Entomortierella beljakovae]|nr:hypothetical protein BGZ76_001622 [Entomortierella beljakovae]
MSENASTVDTQSSFTPSSDTQSHSTQPFLPSEFVFQLILEQFWGDGVSKREIRSVYTTEIDANTACQEYLLRTWPKDQFSLYEIGSSPQRSELSKVSALINDDRFHVWIERHPWKGTLDFSSKAIAKRAGKGPNAYILQRTIKDASGGKRRSTTQGIFATRQLAKQALAHEPLPAEWPSDQGYVQEPGGEYAHALSPSGKTAWLFIEVRPLFMSYTPLEQELQEASASDHLGASALNPISLDQLDDDSQSIPTSPSIGLNSTSHYPPHSIDNPFSPIPSNPDEAGAYVYLVLQLKTIPYTPPILTVEAVAYEIEVANRFGITLLEEFSSPGAVSEPAFREDGCLQGSVERQTRDEGLTVWVEKRAVVLGDDTMDSDLVSEHGTVQLNKQFQNSSRQQSYMSTKRGEPEDGFEATGRPLSDSTPQDTNDVKKVARLIDSESSNGDNSANNQPIDLDARYRVISVTHQVADKESERKVVASYEDKETAIAGARVRFYSLLGNIDLATVEIKDELASWSTEAGDGKEGVIRACSKSNDSLVVLEVRVEDDQ